MARLTTKSPMAALYSLFQKRMGLLGGSPFSNSAAVVDKDFDNNVALSWSDAADTTSIPGISVDIDSRLHLDRQAYLGARFPVTFQINANAALGTQAFFAFPTGLTGSVAITDILYQHATAGNDAGTVTCNIEKLSAGQAPGGGTTVQVGTFNCKATANTTQTASLLAVTPAGQMNRGLILSSGDRLGIVFTGTLTSLAGVVVTVWLAPGYKGTAAVYNMNANASLANQAFFMANRDCVVSGVSVFYSAKGTDAGAVTIDITKETGTTAAAGGTTILSAAVSAKGTINTVITPALTATAATLQLAAGNRLSIKYTGTLTALAGVVVVVWLQGVAANGHYGQIEAPFNILANGSQGTIPILIANQAMEVVDASLIWGTAGTDGGTVTADVQIAKGVTAPGSGTSVTTGATSVKTTANTTAVTTLSVSRRNRLLSRGDRLDLVTAGTLTSLAGLVENTSLRIL